MSPKTTNIIICDNPNINPATIPLEIPVYNGTSNFFSYFLSTMFSEPNDVTVLMLFMDSVIKFEDSL